MYEKSGLQSNCKIQICDESLLGRYRAIEELHKFLKDGVRSNLQERLSEVFNSSDVAVDLRPVVEAFRHLTFHGVHTPGGAKITSASRLTFMEDLTRRVFESLDDDFSSVVAQLSASSGQVEPQRDLVGSGASGD